MMAKYEVMLLCMAEFGGGGGRLFVPRELVALSPLHL